MTTFTENDKKLFPFLAGNCGNIETDLTDAEKNRMWAIGMKLALTQYLLSSCDIPFETPSEEACVSAAANYFLEQAIIAEKTKKQEVAVEKHSPFELEQRIMLCWNIVDDINTLYEAVLERDMTKDEIANVLLGMRTLYPLRFENLFDEFQAQVIEKK